MPSKYGFGNTRKKSPAYKMKGFSGFGNSPAKVSDTEIMNLQSKLNKTELDFKEPGWAKVAAKMHDPFGMMGGEKKGGKSSGGGADKVSGGKGSPGGAVDADTVQSIGELFSKDESDATGLV
mgnify:CR=1 FL=1